MGSRGGGVVRPKNVWANFGGGKGKNMLELIEILEVLRMTVLLEYIDFLTTVLSYCSIRV